MNDSLKKSKVAKNFLKIVSVIFEERLWKKSESTICKKIVPRAKLIKDKR